MQYGELLNYKYKIKNLRYLWVTRREDNKSTTDSTSLT